MNNLIFVLFICAATLFSCRRENTKSIGPELAYASPNFRVLDDSFEFNSDNSDFQNAPACNWFNASFNEKVSWEIKISGTTSKAIKIITGVSDEINQSNSTWHGTHTNVYFFIKGETVIAELSVLGSDKKWVDSSVVTNEIRNFGPDALIWWDMQPLNAGGLGVTIPYWYGYFRTPAEDSVVSWRDLALWELDDPVQGRYRTLFGKAINPSGPWWAGFGHGELGVNSNRGFPGASLKEVYLNFYIRRKTPMTPSMGVTIKSVSGREFVSATLNPFTNKYDSVFTNIFTSLRATVLFSNASSIGQSELLTVPRGYVQASSDGGLGWSLVSIKLSDMEVVPEDIDKPVFNPGRIIQITGSLGAAEKTGFDMDFIVFTRGVPFNKIK